MRHIDGPSGGFCVRRFAQRGLFALGTGCGGVRRRWHAAMRLRNHGVVRAWGPQVEQSGVNDGCTWGGDWRVVNGAVTASARGCRVARRAGPPKVIVYIVVNWRLKPGWTSCNRLSLRVWITTTHLPGRREGLSVCTAASALRAAFLWMKFPHSSRRSCSRLSFFTADMFPCSLLKTRLRYGQLV